MRYRITSRVVDIRETTTVMPENMYGGWMAVNTGTSMAKVLGYQLSPGEGLDFTTAVPAGSTWNDPIRIEIQPGAVVRLTRLQAQQID